jgi:hypothetical protein
VQSTALWMLWDWGGVRYHPGFSGGVAARDFDAPGLRIGKFDTSPLSCDG